MQVKITEGDIVVDAEDLASLLNVPAGDLPEMMRSKAVTSLFDAASMRMRGIIV